MVKDVANLRNRMRLRKYGGFEICQNPNPTLST